MSGAVEVEPGFEVGRAHGAGAEVTESVAFHGVDEIGRGFIPPDRRVSGVWRRGRGR